MSSVTEITAIFMIILVLTYFSCSVYFLILRLKTGEDQARKRIMTLVGFIFFFIAISKLIHLIIIFLHGSAYFTGVLSFENSLLFTFSQISLYVGIIGIIFSFEKKMQKLKKNYATIFSSLTGIIYFIFDYMSVFNPTNLTLELIAKMTSYIFNGVVYLFTFILAFMYLNISLKTSGDVKKKALFVFLGYFLMLISYFVYVLEDLLVDLLTIGILAFVFGMVAVVFLILGYK